MSRLESVAGFMRRTVVSLPFLALVGLIIGGLVAAPLMPKPSVAIIAITPEALLDQAYTDDIVEMLRDARADDSIKAVVLKINSPGGYVVTTEQIYIEVLRLRQQKPVVASVNMIAASGGYYIAAAAAFIYALPTSQVGSIGVRGGLPFPEELDEYTLTSGPFKSTGGSKRGAVAELEMIRQQFVSAVLSNRGDRVILSEKELSRAEVYLGTVSLEYGLVDGIGTIDDAIEKAAGLAGIRNYEVMEFAVSQPSPDFLDPSDLAAIKSQTSLMPIYYYLYVESE